MDCCLPSTIVKHISLQLTGLSPGMPPKRAVDKSDSDDDIILPDDTSSAVGLRRPAESIAPSSRGTTVISDAAPSSRGGVSAIESVNSRDALAPTAGAGSKPAASGGSSDATLALLAQRRLAASRGRGALSSGLPSGRGPATPAVTKAGGGDSSSDDDARAATSKKVAALEREPPSVKEAAAPVPGRRAATSAVSTSKLENVHNAPEPQLPAVATPSPKAGSVAAVPAVPPLPPPAAPQEITEATLVALRKQIDERKKLIAELKQQDAEEQRKHEEEQKSVSLEISNLEKASKVEADRMEEERAQTQQALVDARSEAEAEVRRAKAAYEAELQSVKPQELDALERRVAALRLQKQTLSDGVVVAATNKSLVDAAISSALAVLCDNMDEVFRKQLEADDAWAQRIRDEVRKEIKESFLGVSREDIVSEEREYSTAFEQMLKDWQNADEAEAQLASHCDDKLLAELRSTWQQDLDRLQREEAAILSAYADNREAWIQSYREIMKRELDESFQRRTAEFEELRRLRQAFYADRLAQSETNAKRDMDRDRELHQERMKLLNEQQAAHELLDEERHKANAAIREEAAQTAVALREVASTITCVLERLDKYRDHIDGERDSLEDQRRNVLIERESALNELQQFLVAQVSSIEDERRSLMAVGVKVDTLSGSLKRFAEDQSSWSAKMKSAVERNRTEWEREYRRWQLIADKERRAAEERFHDVVRDLQHATVAIDKEAQQLTLEGERSRLRADERAKHIAAESIALRQRGDDIEMRRMAVEEAMGAIERRRAELSSEWQRLHAARRELDSERSHLAEQQANVANLQERVKHTRDLAGEDEIAAAAAQERSKGLTHNLQMARASAAQEQKVFDSFSRRVVGLGGNGVNREVLRERIVNPPSSSSDGSVALPTAMLAELTKLTAASLSRRQPASAGIRHRDPGVLFTRHADGTGMPRAGAVSSDVARRGPGDLGGELAVVPPQLLPLGTPRDSNGEEDLVDVTASATTAPPDAPHGHSMNMTGVSGYSAGADATNTTLPRQRAGDASRDFTRLLGFSTDGDTSAGSSTVAGATRRR